MGGVVLWMEDEELSDDGVGGGFGVFVYSGDAAGADGEES